MIALGVVLASGRTAPSTTSTTSAWTTTAWTTARTPRRWSRPTRCHPTAWATTRCWTASPSSASTVLQACDDLYQEALSEPGYADYGLTCGGRVEEFAVYACTRLE
ncbi:hypothetical protein [Modestobacter sp. SYSU DS0657]